MDETTHICPWCSTPIAPGASACSKCGALVEGAVATEIPGVTVVDPEATLGPKPGVVPNPLSWLQAGSDVAPTSEAAFQPPSEEVLREMRKIELETQIENAGTEVMNPTGDESLDAAEPSDEALAAEEAGLLDETGPAGETDLAELAGTWEDPELEKRVHLWQEGDEEH